MMSSKFDETSPQDMLCPIIKDISGINDIVYIKLDASISQFLLSRVWQNMYNENLVRFHAYKTAINSLDIDSL